MRILFTLTLILAALSLNARRITADEAMKVASDVLHSSQASLIAEVNNDGMMKATPNGKDSKSEPYYVFNKGSNEGFVIISGDERVQKILGYSDRGNFDPNNVPPQLKAMMNRWAEQISGLSDYEGTTHPSWKQSFSTRAGEGVQLETVNWGQGYPYNLKCPMIGEVQAPSGCVATAMAIVMKYHNWPESTQGVVYTDFNNRDLTVDFSSTVIDWNALDGDPESEGFKEAVSHLNLIAGVSTDTYYTSGESSADLVLLGHKLMENFKYSPDCQFIERQYFDDRTWNKMITDQLDASQPVVYFGNAGAGTTGHAYVIDGYSPDGLYHINWGWDGMCNGSFSLESLAPNDLNFSECQGMVMNIVPDKSGRVYSRAFISNTDMYVSAYQPNDDYNFTTTEIKPGEKFSFIPPHIIMPYFQWTGDFALVIMDENDNIVTKLFNDDYSDIGWRRFTGVTDDGCHMPGVLMTFLEMESPGLKQGERYQLVCREKGSDEWQIVTGGIRKPSYFGDTGLRSEMCQVNLHYDKDAPILMETETKDTNYWLKGDGFGKNFYYGGGDITLEFKCFDADKNEQEPVYVDDFWEHKQGVSFNMTLIYPYNDIYIHWKKYDNTRHDDGKDTGSIHTVDGLVYEIVDNAAILIGYESADKESIKIPDFIEVAGEKYPVTEIENNALTYYGSLRHIELGKNIKIVHPYALGLLPNLKSVGISSQVDFGRMPANWSENITEVYFLNREAQSSSASFLNRQYEDNWFNWYCNDVNIYLTDLEYFDADLYCCTKFIPGLGKDKDPYSTEMWNYAIDRTKKCFKVEPMLKDLRIESVLVNGKEVPSYKNHFYEVESTDNMEVTVNFRMHNTQPMTVTYAAEYNETVPNTILTGVDEIFGEAGTKLVDVYNLQGVKVVSKASKEDIKGLPSGIYIIDGNKLRIK